MTLFATVVGWLKYALLALNFALLAGCGLMSVIDEQGRVYHCVGMTQPIPPSGVWAPKRPVEFFEYGLYQRRDTPTIGGSYYCNVMSLPATAYLRYRVDGNVVEKRFDLSSLTPHRVHEKTVEFYVDGETVAVRLVTPVPGTFPTIEVVTRQ